MSDAHPFSVFGPAPYRFVSLETADDREAEQSYRRGAGLTYTTNLCGGACDLCGTAIFNVYTFEAANGRRFKVGCDCAEKAGEGEACKAGKRTHDREARDRATKAEIAARLQAERDRNLAEIGEAITNAERFDLTKAMQAFEDALVRAGSWHIGDLGKRIKRIAVRLERRFTIETMWGYKTCYKLRTFDGNALTWWTASGCLGTTDADGYWINAERGTILEIAATVKRHGEYKGERQTEVQRVKVLALEVPRLPTRESLE